MINASNAVPFSSAVQSVALVGSYPPRQCGIATFTKDLRDAISGPGGVQRTAIIALDDTTDSYSYPQEVAFQVPAFHRRDYFTAADILNINRVDVAIVQHEFGIFGGANGEYVLDLVGSLRMPVLTTLHTVITEPSPGQAKIINDLGKSGNRCIVMSQLAKAILQEKYTIRPDRITYIPHGIPDVPFVDPAYYKDRFGFEGRTVLLTFGLLSSGKGIEVAIRALPAIIKEFPSALYVILGATHPHILKREGNAYRNSLVRLAERLGVSEHITFHNRFVTLEELCGYIGAADLYITPYVSKAQITSGTLAYAMGAGKACISTPFWYAEELLADGRGRLFPFNDSEALAATVNALLSDEVERNAIRKRAYTYGRSMIWSEVARSYIQVCREAMDEARRRPRAIATLRKRAWNAETVPEISLKHLETLTDRVGILQHAICTVPDRTHGYCTDDNARALIAVLKHHSLYSDKLSLEMASVYLAFLNYAFNAKAGRFKNFMNYERVWLDEVGSEDSHARALGALAIAASLAPNQSVLSFAVMQFHNALPACEQFTSPRALATVLIAIHTYLHRFSGDTTSRRMREVLALRLYHQFKKNATDEWPWIEDTLTYDNARLAQALVLSGQWLPHNDMLSAGLRSLNWLYKLQTHDDGRVNLIGNMGWMKRNGDRAHFDQQPLDALALIEACAEAYRCTQEELWLKRARQCFGWFLGNNDKQAVLYDFETGGCSDGLGPGGTNLNQGAESTLAWLISLLTIQELLRRELDHAEEQSSASPEPSHVVST